MMSRSKRRESPCSIPSAAARIPRVALAAALAMSAVQASAQAPLPNPHSSAFVTTYRCDGESWLAIAYPAPFAREAEPVRLSWQGETVVLKYAGGRYVSRDADLAWRPKGRTGTLTRLSDRSMLLDNCVER